MFSVPNQVCFGTMKPIAKNASPRHLPALKMLPPALPCNRNASLALKMLPQPSMPGICRHPYCNSLALNHLLCYVPCHKMTNLATRPPESVRTHEHCSQAPFGFLCWPHCLFSDLGFIFWCITFLYLKNCGFGEGFAKLSL